MKRLVTIILVLISSSAMSQTVSKKDSILNYLHNYDYSKIDSTIISRKFSVDEFVAFANKNYNTDRDKARACYSFVIDYMTYDSKNYQIYLNNMTYNERFYRNEYMANYAIKDKFGVCDNYASLYKILSIKIGLKSEYISGYAKEYNEIANGSLISNHAWNIVTIDNIKYLLDVTFDDCRQDGYKISSKWFIIKPEVFIESHYPLNSHWIDYAFVKKVFYYNFIKYDANVLFVTNAYKTYKNKENDIQEQSKLEMSKQLLEKPITFEYFLCTRNKTLGDNKYIPFRTLPSNYYNLYL